MHIYHELLRDRPAAEVIRKYFDGDKDDALATAEAIVRMYARPPSWVRELTGPVPGWRDTTGRWRF